MLWPMSAIVVAAIRREALCQQLAERRDVEPPVVVEQHGVETGLAQRQRQLEVAVVHRAQRDDARCVAHAQLGQAAEGDIDGIEPENVVRPLAAANETELRAHDAGQHVHAALRRRRVFRLRVVARASAASSACSASPKYSTRPSFGVRDASAAMSEPSSSASRSYGVM